MKKGLLTKLSLGRQRTALERLSCQRSSALGKCTHALKPLALLLVALVELSVSATAQRHVDVSGSLDDLAGSFPTPRPVCHVAATRASDLCKLVVFRSTTSGSEGADSREAAATAAAEEVRQFHTEALKTAKGRYEIGWVPWDPAAPPRSLTGAPAKYFNHLQDSAQAAALSASAVLSLGCCVLAGSCSDHEVPGWNDSIKYVFARKAFQRVSGMIGGPFIEEGLPDLYNDFVVAKLGGGAQSESASTNLKFQIAENRNSLEDVGVTMGEFFLLMGHMTTCSPKEQPEEFNTAHACSAEVLQWFGAALAPGEAFAPAAPFEASAARRSAASARFEAAKLHMRRFGGGLVGEELGCCWGWDLRAPAPRASGARPEWRPFDEGDLDAAEEHLRALKAGGPWDLRLEAHALLEQASFLRRKAHSQTPLAEEMLFIEMGKHLSQAVAREKITEASLDVALDPEGAAAAAAPATEVEKAEEVSRLVGCSKVHNMCHLFLDFEETKATDEEVQATAARLAGELSSESSAVSRQQVARRGHKSTVRLDIVGQGAQSAASSPLLAYAASLPINESSVDETKMLGLACSLVVRESPVFISEDSYMFVDGERLLQRGSLAFSQVMWQLQRRAAAGLVEKALRSPALLWQSSPKDSTFSHLAFALLLKAHLQTCEPTLLPIHRHACDTGIRSPLVAAAAAVEPTQALARQTILQLAAQHTGHREEADPAKDLSATPAKQPLVGTGPDITGTVLASEENAAKAWKALTATRDESAVHKAMRANAGEMSWRDVPRAAWKQSNALSFTALLELDKHLIRTEMASHLLQALPDSVPLIGACAVESNGMPSGVESGFWLSATLPYAAGWLVMGSGADLETQLQAAELNLRCAQVQAVALAAPGVRWEVPGLRYVRWNWTLVPGLVAVVAMILHLLVHWCGTRFFGAEDVGLAHLVAYVVCIGMRLAGHKILWRKPKEEGAGSQEQGSKTGQGGGSVSNLLGQGGRASSRRRRRGTHSKCAPSDAAGAAAQEPEEPEWWRGLGEWHERLEREAAAEYKCPITCMVMRQPAMLVETGNSFEHHAIARWVRQEGQHRDPLTNEGFVSPEIVVNKGLHRTIRTWCEESAEEWTREKNASKHMLRLKLGSTSFRISMNSK